MIPLRKASQLQIPCEVQKDLNQNIICEIAFDKDIHWKRDLRSLAHLQGT